MIMVSYRELYSTFCCHLCAASSGVLLALFITAVEGGSWIPNSPMQSSLRSVFWATAVAAAGALFSKWRGRRRWTSRTMALARLESGSLPLLQRGSRYIEQRAPAAAVAQWRGKRRQTSETTASAGLESSSLLLPQCSKKPEGPLLRMPHSDDGETLSRSQQ